MSARRLPLLAIFVLATPSWAAPKEQTPKPFSLAPKALLQLANSKEAPADKDVEFVLVNDRLQFDERGRMTRTKHRIYRILTADGVDGHAEIEDHYAPWHQAKPKIRARVITAKGAVHHLDPKTITNQSDDDGAPAMFTDGRLVRGPLPAVSVGAVVETETVVADTEPFFSAGNAGSISIPVGIPTRTFRLVFDYPKSVPLKHRIEHLALTPRTSTAAGRITALYEASDLGREKPEPFEPLSPHEQFAWPSIHYSTGESWQAIAAAYGKWVDQQLVGPALEAQAREIAGNETDPKKIAGRLLGWVTSTVRYTGLEFGIAAIQPRTPKETLARKYGDCKDLSTLLVGLLRAVGMDARVAMVKVYGPPPSADLPGLGWFNHAIVHVRAPVELWIDPTSKSTPVGELPTGDQGRAALTAEPRSTSLVRLPVSSSTDNRLRVIRRMILSEFEAGEIHERWESTGSIGATHRENFGTKSEAQLKEWATNYVKSALKAEELISVKVVEGRVDLPFALELSARKSKMVFTEDRRAVAWISEGHALEWLPDTLTAPRPEPSSDSADEEAEPKSRKAPLEMPVPFQAEVIYQVTWPEYLEPKPLPTSDTIAFGPAKLERKYTLSNGTIEARYNFDSGPRRYEPQQVDAFRTAYRDFAATDASAAHFEHRGRTLLAERKPRQAVDEYKRLIAKHPKEALHRIHLASVLLELGYNDEALRLMREAVAVEPSSAPSHRVLGWHLEHDGFSRRFGAGFARDEAIRAYREAKRLNPKDAIARAALAILLEHDTSGRRYGPKANLDEAIKEYEGLRDELNESTYNDNLLIALMKAGRYKELRTIALKLPAGNVRNQAVIVGSALLTSPEAALAEATRIAPVVSERVNLLSRVSATLAQLRDYRLATIFAREAASRASNAVELNNRATMLARVKRHEEFSLDENDPRTVVLKVLRQIFLSRGAASEWSALLSNAARAESTDREREMAAFKGVREMLEQLEATGMTLDGALDFAFSLLSITVEGDGRVGHKVSVRQGVGGQAASQVVFVIKEAGSYRVRAFDSTPAQIGQEALARVGASDLEAARQWLDWARQLYPPDISAEDQPYLAFAMLWAPGQRADAETTRRAAATLAVQAKSGTDAVKIVEEAVRKARSDVERRRYELALLPAFVAADRWSEFHDGARKVIERQPRSTKAFSMAMMALARQRKFDAAEELARARLRLIPNDPQALMELATTMSSKGDFERAEQFGRKALVAGDKSGIYNNLAWYSLFRRGGVTPAALEDARRASELDPESGAITHTLATLYAEIGQVTEAHELLAKLMAKNKTAPPDPSAFYVHARVAEHLGLTEVATDSYRRAMGEPQKDGWEHPESVRTLAMSQLKRMKAPMVAVPTP